MVSTRHHPRGFSSAAEDAKDVMKLSKSSAFSNGSATQGWVHTPSVAVTLWLVLSIPLVLWDSSYVLLRPHSMPGNKLHSPIWTPYALYGTIDYIYGWPAFNAKNGFTAAQTIMNLVETAGYLYYFAIIYFRGVPVASSTGRPQQRVTRKGFIWLFHNDKVVSGRAGAFALLVAYSASVMTVGKTALYWLNEVCSGFANIGHNDIFTLIFMWILPNGLWLIFPSYNIYILGSEIIDSLAAAAPRPKAG